MTPKQKERLEAKIKAIKAALAADKKRWGGYYDDSRGLRYAPPNLYIQIRDFSGGLRYHNWFEKNFSNDVAYKEFFIDFALILFKSKKIKLAEKTIFKAFYYQRFGHERTFELEILPPEGKRLSTFLAELMFMDYISLLSIESDFSDFLTWLESFIQSEKFVNAGDEIVKLEKSKEKGFSDKQEAIFDNF